MYILFKRIFIQGFVYLSIKPICSRNFWIVLGNEPDIYTVKDTVGRMVESRWGDRMWILLRYNTRLICWKFYYFCYKILNVFNSYCISFKVILFENNFTCVCRVWQFLWGLIFIFTWGRKFIKHFINLIAFCYVKLY